LDVRGAWRWWYRVGEICPAAAAYFRKVKRDFEEASRILQSTNPEPVELCNVCSWFPICDKRRRDDDHLSWVAGITSLQRKELVAREINTVARLGSLFAPPLFRRSSASGPRRCAVSATRRVFKSRGETKTGFFTSFWSPLRKARASLFCRCRHREIFFWISKLSLTRSILVWST
jgi:hypothetical protein